MNDPRKRPFILGVTGGLGSGKSTVCRLLGQRSVPVVDADEISRECMVPGRRVFEEAVAEFGPGILDEQGQIHRSGLAEKVFGDPEARRRLEEIIHPFVIRAIKDRIADFATQGTRLVVLDVPLLYEAGLDAMCDEVWVVWCRRDQQLDRVVQRGSLTREAARRRLEAQMPLEEKVRRADRVIDNTGSPGELVGQVQRAWECLTGGKEHGT